MKNDYMGSNQKSNDHLKQNYLFDDCELLTEDSVSTCSQNSLKTYPFFLHKKKECKIT